MHFFQPHQLTLYRLNQQLHPLCLSTNRVESVLKYRVATPVVFLDVEEVFGGSITRMVSWIQTSLTHMKVYKDAYRMINGFKAGIRGTPLFLLEEQQNKWRNAIRDVAQEYSPDWATHEIPSTFSPVNDRRALH